jgi:hypothetical protein
MRLSDAVKCEFCLNEKCPLGATYRKCPDNTRSKQAILGLQMLEICMFASGCGDLRAIHEFDNFRKSLTCHEWVEISKHTLDPARLLDPTFAFAPRARLVRPNFLSEDMPAYRVRVLNQFLFVAEPIALWASDPFVGHDSSFSFQSCLTGRYCRC